MSKICYLVGAGECNAMSFPAKSRIIAVDGGMNALITAGVRPDLLVGDFDSLNEVPGEVPVRRFPIKKDDTDMLLGLKEAIAAHEKTVAIYGGMGGRPDHTYANLQMLAYGAEQGVRVFLLGKDYVATAFCGELRFPATLSGTVSVFAYGTANGVDIEGLCYSLSGATVTDRFPIGVSNSFCGKEAVVRVRKGVLLCMWSERTASLLSRLAKEE